MRRVLLVIAAVPLLLFAAIVLQQVIARAANARRLGALEEQFSKLEHPPGSHQLAIDSQVGLLEGNGNHCDFFVGALRSGTPPISYRDPNVEVVLLGDAGAWSSLPPRDRLIEQGEREKPIAGEVLYLVWLFDQTAAGDDFRCH